MFKNVQLLVCLQFSEVIMSHVDVVDDCSMFDAGQN